MKTHTYLILGLIILSLLLIPAQAETKQVKVTLKLYDHDGNH